MNAILAILSQLFWGVTVGALGASAVVLMQVGAVGCGLFGAGYGAYRLHRRYRRGDKDR